MLPEKLEYIARVQKFINVLIESAKTNQISEEDFYLIMKAKVKAMDRERREKGKPKI
ncbi:hypothetical protein ES708_17999 [subsurface metagenome]